MCEKSPIYVFVIKKNIKYKHNEEIYRDGCSLVTATMRIVITKLSLSKAMPKTNTLALWKFTCEYLIECPNL